MMGLFDSGPMNGQAQWGNTGVLGQQQQQMPNMNYWGSPNGFNQWQGADMSQMFGQHQQPQAPMQQGPMNQQPGATSYQMPQLQMPNMMSGMNSPFSAQSSVLDAYGGQPQKGPMMGGQPGGDVQMPQQPSNPFAALGRFGW